MNKFTVIIRNKNEGESLKKTLSILDKLYKNYINEIIIVDNKSSDNSIEIAKSYNCVIVNIDNFSYGKAINYGMRTSKTKFNLLLSSHAIPVGNSFFANTFLHLNDNVAGVRYVNSFESYSRSITNDFKVKEPISFGLNAACCIVNKDVWNHIKFDENLKANEDKHWSLLVSNSGYEIIDLNESYYYFKKRNSFQKLKRYKIETITHNYLLNKNFSSKTRLFLGFIYKILVTNSVQYVKGVYLTFLTLVVNFEIHNELKKQKKEKL